MISSVWRGKSIGRVRLWWTLTVNDVGFLPALEIRLVISICRVMFLSLRCLEQNGSDRRSASGRQFNKEPMLGIVRTRIMLSLCVFLCPKKQGSDSVLSVIH